MLDRLFGDRGVLHVDPHEDAARARGFQDAPELLAAQRGASSFNPSAVSLTEMFASRPMRRDGVEGPPVFRHGLLRLGHAHDVFAEHVEGRQAPLPVQAADGCDRVVQRFAGHVSRRDAAHDRPRHEGQRPASRPLTSGFTDAARGAFDLSRVPRRGRAREAPHLHLPGAWPRAAAGRTPAPSRRRWPRRPRGGRAGRAP